MTRDGLIEVNETQQTAERISKREQDADFQKSPEQQTTQDGTQLQGLPSQTSPLPHAPGAALFSTKGQELFMMSQSFSSAHFHLRHLYKDLRSKPPFYNLLTYKEPWLLG